MKDEKDQNLAVNAVKRWLQAHSSWLLILDNADNLVEVLDLLPKELQGHVLLTTRTLATGTDLQEVEIEIMKPEEAILFLLRRAKFIELDASLDIISEGDRSSAKEIAEMMDGLPLALAQAGAYIEKTRCGLSGYLLRFQSRQEVLLKEGGGTDSYYTKSVATTWSLSFEKIEEMNPFAADLLRLCAFLQPDAIPEEMILDGASELGSILQPVIADLFELDKAFEELLRYSLIRRNSNATITIHRLVQSVLKNNMDAVTQHQWAERAVRVVNRAFPNVEFEKWSRCQLCIPHAQVCMALIKQWDIKNEASARLLDQAGDYLRERVQYREAEPLLKKALSIRETMMEPDDPTVAQSLFHLARYYYDQGNFMRAESLYRQALEIQEKVLGIDDPEVAKTLNYLGLLYHDEGKSALALQLHQRALHIRENVLGLDHPDVAYSLVNLAGLDLIKADHKQRELYLMRALSIFEDKLKPEHPDIATCLLNLASACYDSGKYDLGLSYTQRALTIAEKTLGKEHLLTAGCLDQIAHYYFKRRDYALAESFVEQALAIDEKVLGNEHPTTVAKLYHLALTYREQGRYETAKPLFRKVISLWEKTFGFDNIKLVAPLESFANLLRETNQNKEASNLEGRAKLISSKHAQENIMDSNNDWYGGSTQSTSTF